MRLCPMFWGWSLLFVQVKQTVNCLIRAASAARKFFLLEVPSRQKVAWPMITRAAKLLLLSGIALYYSLVVFNNLTDFGSNYQFVQHVLAMDTTFPGNHGMGRALTSPAAHLAFYLSIIAWEIVTTILLWWGSV